MKKNHNSVIKSIFSGVMAFALALTMCMMAVPTKVLASDLNIWYVHSNGVIDKQSDPGPIVFSLATRDPALPTTISYSDNTLKFNGDTTISSFEVHDNNKVVSIKGTCFSSIKLANGISNITISMSEGSSLTVAGFFYYDPADHLIGLEEAYNTGKLKLINGKFSADRISYDESSSGGDEPTPTPTPTPAPTEINVGEEVSEKGKTSEEAPTYKVTKKDGNTGEITYEKPATKAENIKEVEEIPSEVILGDGNTYKVTKVGERAFADIPGNDKIKEIKFGENVEEIGVEACKGLPSLEKITFNKKVKKIDKGAFALCKNLKKADLPADLEEVGESAFEKTNISSASFGKNVKKIDKKAYYKCKKLKKLTVKSKKLTKKSRVAKNAFAGASKKLKVKIKVSKAKTKDSIIKVFKQKKIGYKSTWTVN